VCGGTLAGHGPACSQPPNRSESGQPAGAGALAKRRLHECPRILSDDDNEVVRVCRIRAADIGVSVVD
jgi:hypothetical protein